MCAKGAIQSQRQTTASANSSVQITKNAYVRAAKTIDTLFCVADDKQSPDRSVLGAGQSFDDFTLALVRILKFVDQ